MLRVILITLNMFFCIQGYAEEEELVSDAIAELCNITDEESFDREQGCMLYYVNCIVGKGGKWTDKQIFKCAKERNNGS